MRRIPRNAFVTALRLGWPLAAMLAGAGCDGAASVDTPIEVSVIGPAPAIVDPSQKRLPPPSAVLLTATAQGLVRLDASGQVEPGLAIRWDVSDDGLYYTFRLDAEAELDAEDVAGRLRSAIGPTSRNPLKRELAVIADVVAVTDAVIEIRLRAPRPDLLPLLAQPDLAVIGAGDGSGPFRIAARSADRLRLATMRARSAEDEPSTVADIILRGERAARAVARFAAGHADLVLGGRFTDVAVAQAIDPRRGALRIDPTAGLFGLAILTPDGFLGAADNRSALAMAIDRDRIVRTLAPGWPSETALVPTSVEDVADPASPDWAAVDLPTRMATAREIVSGWRQVQPAPAPPPVVRVAVPAGAAGRLLYTLIAIDWRRIGVDSVMVGPDAPADLRLVDLVAPTSGTAWYLHHFTCDRSPVCSAEADAAMLAARAAGDLATRSARLADADRLLTRAVPFISLATPLRWSLVAPNLDGYRDNPRAIHPLDQLRGGS